MRGKLLLATTVLAVGMGACANIKDKTSAVLFPANPSSWKVKGESTSIDLTYAKPTDAQLAAGCPEPINFTEGFRVHGLGAEAAAAAVDLIIKEIGKFLEEESKRYTATYSATAMGDRFYDGCTTRASINLKRIAFQRMVEGQPAMNLTFDVNGTYDGTAFELRPSNLKVALAKAKLPGFEWLNPGSWFDGLKYDNDLDLTVAVRLYGVWVDDKQEGHITLVSDGSFKVRDLELGQVYGSGGKPIPGGDFLGTLSPAIPRSVLGAVFDTKTQQVFGPKLAMPGANESTRFPGFASESRAIATPLLGTGNFFITILVTEHDDYGERIKEVADKVDEKRPEIVAGVRNRF